MVHLNDGRGRFVVGSTFGREEWTTRHVSVADLNRDGEALVTKLKARADEMAERELPALNRRLWELGIGAIWKE